jgi:uncharacterized protein YdaU (DUF1376 family)
MPFFWGDYFADTQHLDTEENGAYLLLLGTMWMASKGELPDDDERLARIARAKPARWKTKLRPAIATFFIIENGVWRQLRLEKEKKFVAKNCEQRKAAANARWSNKSLNNNKPPHTDAYAETDDVHMHPYLYKKVSKKEITYQEDKPPPTLDSARASPGDGGFIPDDPIDGGPSPFATERDAKAEAATVVAEFHKLRSEGWPNEAKLPAPGLTLAHQAATVLADLPLATVLEVMRQELDIAIDKKLKAPQSLRAYDFAFEKAKRGQNEPASSKPKPRKHYDPDASRAKTLAARAIHLGRSERGFA